MSEAPLWVLALIVLAAWLFTRRREDERPAARAARWVYTPNVRVQRIAAAVAVLLWLGVSAYFWLREERKEDVLLAALGFAVVAYFLYRIAADWSSRYERH